MIVISFLVAGLGSCDDKKNFIIDHNITVFVSQDEPLPVQKAAVDLKEDLQKVLGEEINLAYELEDCDTNAIMILHDFQLPGMITKPQGRERFLQQVITKPFAEAGIQQALVLSGSDLRGVIYSIYDFSEKHLGIDPLYWWSDIHPENKSFINIPSALQYVSPAPTVRYRGLFVNDEDLLSGWKTGTWFLSGIDPEVWDKLFETILRLKGNMVTPGTFIFPYEPQVKAAGDRGLIITQHHAEVLGLNVYRWPDDIPYSFQSNRDKLISAWSKAVQQYTPDQEVIWTVGYRGRHDRAFWEDEKNSPATQQARAELIRKAIDSQIEIVKKYRKNPEFFMNAWGEGMQLIKDGFLELPEEVTLVWADGGWGRIRDDGEISDGQGVYYHVAMFNHKSNQLTEMVPVSRIQQEMGRAVRAGATEYFLLNTSDFKPVMMSAQAALNIAWQAEPWLQDDDYHQKYLHDWFGKQFGKQIASQLKQIYNQYYLSPAKYGPDETYRMGDNYYTRMVKLYCRRMETGDTTTYMEKVDNNQSVSENARILLDICNQAAPRWDSLYREARDLITEIPENRQDFYQAHVLTPIEIHLYGNKMLIGTMQAFLEEDQEQKIELLNRATVQIDCILASFTRAEYGKWHNFYQNDFMTGFRGARKCIQLTMAKYQNRKTYEDISNYINDWDLWDLVKSYQGNQEISL